MGDEAYEEANAFIGKRWSEIDREFAHRYRDALFWFRPDAFHYYLPAFLRAAEAGAGFAELFVGNLLTIIIPDGDPGLMSFRKERLERLTEPQVEWFKDWLGRLIARTSSAEPEWERMNLALLVLKGQEWLTW